MNKGDGGENNMRNKIRVETLCLDRISGSEIEFDSLVTPVYRASTVIFPTVEKYKNRREEMYDGYSYGHYGTPTSRELELRLSLLEGAKRTILVPSGMAAIALTCYTVARPGQTVMFPDTIYDTVRGFASELLISLGIQISFYDPLIGAGIADLLSDNIALVWVESPGSFTLEVQDVPAISAAAHALGIIVAADNTWASPLRCKPLELGVDISINSLSKSISGHSDVVMGSLSVNDKKLYRRLKDLSRFFGYGVHADAASLVLRGLETLAVRLDRSEASALELATWLTECPSIDEVRHPALPSHPGHDLWKRDFKGSTGMFSFIVAERVRSALAAGIEAMRHFKIGSSWGGTHSVIAVLDQAPIRTVAPWIHIGSIVRLNVGLEHIEDLREDLQRALTIWGSANSG